MLLFKTMLHESTHGLEAAVVARKVPYIQAEAEQQRPSSRICYSEGSSSIV